MNNAIKIPDIHVGRIKLKETGRTAFRILGDARDPVKNMFLNEITIDRVHDKKSHYQNAAEIQESHIEIGN
jgi:hypothetical protein